MTLKEVRPETVISTRQTVPIVDQMPDYRCSMFQRAHDWLQHNHLRPRRSRARPLPRDGVQRGEH